MIPSKFNKDIILDNSHYLRGINKQTGDIINLIRATNGLNAIGDSNFPTRIWSSERITAYIQGIGLRHLAHTEDYPTIYTSLEQISSSLSWDTANLNNIYSAMSTPSIAMLYCDAGSYISTELGHNNGCEIYIVKNTNWRGFAQVYLYGQNRHYYAFSNNNNRLQWGDRWSYNSEIATGEWIDGKIIYKKYVSGTTQSGGTAVTLVSGATNIIDHKVYVKRNGQAQYHEANYGMTESAGSHVSPVFINTSISSIQLYITMADFKSQPFYGWVRYTKD